MSASQCLTPGDFLQLDRGILDRGTEASLRRHLAGCKSCAAAYQQHSRDATLDAPVRRPASGKPPILDDDEPDTDASTPPTSKASKHHPTIEGYRILGVLGQGGMGIVYRAVQTKLNRTVALKVLPAMIGAANPSAVARFRREATAAARLHHTNIIPIYDFGESRDAYYYAMELIQGQPLSAVIGQLSNVSASSASPARLAQLLHTVTNTMQGDAALLEPGSDEVIAGSSANINTSSTGRGRPYFAQVAKWMADASEALHYAHGQNIIHRDVKPANIILSIDGRIMIADFGLAKSTEEESVTMTGSLLGTLRYISPEQAMAKRVRVDHRTDIYSLGATMYELLTFQPAYPGTDDKEILGAIISRDPTPSRKILSAVPHELETICMKMMEKSPDKRYPTARAAAEDLRRYLNDMPIVARRPGRAARVIKFVRRHRAATISVAAAILLTGSTALVIHEKNSRVVQQELRVRAEKAQRAAEVDKLVEAGHQWWRGKDWARAAEHYGAALKIDPNHVRALCGLGVIKKELYNSSPQPDPKLLDESLELVNSGIAIEPTEERLWNVKGVVLRIKGDFAGAVAAHREAVKCKPKDPTGYSNLSVVEAVNGEFEAAEQTFKIGTDLARQDTTTKWKIWRNRAALQLFRGNPEVQANIAEAVRVDPSDYWAGLIRAKMHLSLPGQINPSKALDSAIAADLGFGESEPKAKRIRALAHLRKEQFESALECAHAAIDLKDDSPMNQLVIVIASAKQGDMSSAKHTYEKALASWPADLSKPGSHRGTADEGVLWFDTADELIVLRDEAAKLLGVEP